MSIFYEIGYEDCKKMNYKGTSLKKFKCTLSETNVKDYEKGYKEAELHTIYEIYSNFLSVI